MPPTACSLVVALRRRNGTYSIWNSYLVRGELKEPACRLIQQAKDISERLNILSMQRNTLSPIDFLPDELLGEIFHEVFLLHPDKPRPHGGCSTEFDASWTRLMLVCRRWGQVGLTEHRMWSSILDGSRSYKGLSFRQRLARSSHHLLTCRFDLGREPNEVGFLLNEHGGRIRGLEVTGNAFQFDAIFNGVSKLPSLRELPARCVTRYSDVHWVPDVVDGIAPQ